MKITVKRVPARGWVATPEGAEPMVFLTFRELVVWMARYWFPAKGGGSRCVS